MFQIFFKGCQTEVRDKTNKKRRPNNSVSSLVKKDSSSRQLQVGQLPFNLLNNEWLLKSQLVLLATRQQRRQIEF